MSCIQPIKRGDTFTVACTYKEDGIPTSVAPYTIRAQVRNSRLKLIAELVVSKANQSESPGVFTLSGGEIDWNPSQYQCDIEFVDNEGVVRSSQTFNIPVEQDITSE